MVSPLSNERIAFNAAIADIKRGASIPYIEAEHPSIYSKFWPELCVIHESHMRRNLMNRIN